MQATQKTVGQIDAEIANLNADIIEMLKTSKETWQQ